MADLITPFMPNLSIDEEGLARLLERVVPHVQAVFLASPETGEGMGLDPAQRAELLEKALIALSPRAVPIFIWVTQETQEGTQHTLDALEKVRLDRGSPVNPVFWVDTPLYYHSNRGLPDHYRRLVDTSSMPFLLHNSPNLIKTVARPLKRHNIRTSILKELADLAGIGGMIFSGTLERAHHYRRASRRVSAFRIYDGDESHFLDHPSMSGTVAPVQTSPQRPGPKSPGLPCNYRPTRKSIPTTSDRSGRWETTFEI
ncbi:MAG: dihydrodipicolinate synthase family protein [Deltaproteobacteria bacterium]|nr:dihydrodipicolinate synthase family protein [Deltaproteobacteria bacterium]